jgi:8-oxo-dGTP diphosphatase
VNTSEQFVLLRHARAGRKLADPIKDFGRGLDREGDRVALLLPELVTGYLRPVAVLSSPYRRCVQTVTPLATVLGLGVEEDARFSPSARAVAVREAFSLVAADSVVCTHGEIIRLLLGGAVKCAKGAFWIVERRHGTLCPTHYVAPPVR